MINKDKFPFIRQQNACDCGITAIRIMAEYYNILPKEEILKFETNINNDGVSVREIIHISHRFGFVCKAFFCTFDFLTKIIKLPVIAYYSKHHYVVVYDFTIHTVKIADPAIGKIQTSMKQFCREWLIKNNMGIIITYGLCERNVI
ncbi:MAG: hypothetical protein IJK42_07435 [Prevotella sp.]|nr:hypothetical protein [Prevotella sp.]